MSIKFDSVGLKLNEKFVKNVLDFLSKTKFKNSGLFQPLDRFAFESMIRFILIEKKMHMVFHLPIPITAL